MNEFFVIYSLGCTIVVMNRGAVRVNIAVSSFINTDLIACKCKARFLIGLVCFVYFINMCVLELVVESAIYASVLSSVACHIAAYSITQFSQFLAQVMNQAF
jgi:hypothetical protein